MKVLQKIISNLYPSPMKYRLEWNPCGGGPKLNSLKGVLCLSSTIFIILCFLPSSWMLPKLKAKNFLIRFCAVSKCLVSKKKWSSHYFNINYPSVAGGNQIKCVHDNEPVLSSFTEGLICAKQSSKFRLRSFILQHYVLYSSIPLSNVFI